MKFAEGTTVAVEKTRAEIETLARKHGATEFSSGWHEGEAGLSFVIQRRRVKFVVPMPNGTEKAIADRARRLSRRNWGAPEAGKLKEVIAEEERRRWRCMLLAIKSKLVNVEEGVFTFEEEFLAHIVTDTGETVFERLRQGGDAGGRLLPPIGG